MIFVTVGTHEQQFNRLIKAIDNLKKEEKLKDEVFIQIGYSTYEPQYCQYKKLLTFDEMDKMYKEADMIITHGGPASFMKALELNKTPIVVPRQKVYEEHINDHQVEFVKAVEERFANIIGVYNISELENALQRLQEFDYSRKKNNSNNKQFNEQLIRILE